MKICLITLDYEGGMIHYSSNLANALSKKNEVYMIVPDKVDPNRFDKNINIFYIPWPDRILSMKSLRFDILIRYILDIRPDVVHITIKHPWVITLISFLKIKKFPIVSTLHDIKKHVGDWDSYLWILSLNILKKFSDIIIVHGDSLKKELISEGIHENKIKVIPHGDYEFFTRFNKKNIDEENSILLFGRILKYKGLEYLLRSIPIIIREIPDIKITIAGKGDLSDYTELIEKNSPYLKIYNTFIKDQNVAELFQRSKLVVLPYIEASQSGIIHIAYAFRKPVIATNVGALPEVVDSGKTGLLIPPKDVDALAQAIIKLLKNDKLRNEMGENAYKKMKNEMSWDKIAEKTIDVYKEAIKLYDHKINDI